MVTVHTFLGFDGPNNEYVTHADYKALEAKCESLEYHGRKMAEEIGSFTAELAECRKDAERLDELELGKRADVRWYEGGEQELVGYEWGCGGPYATVRDALDAAIDARRTQEKKA